MLLALVSAVTYGVSDYLGGRESRRSSPLTVTLATELTIVPVVMVLVPVLEDRPPTGSALLWGALAGLAGIVGLLGFYAALARGAMTVVAPIAGLVGVLLPLVVGLVSGERPGVGPMIGIVVAVIAVALVGGAVGALHQSVTVSTVVLAAVTGALFGLLFVALAQPGEEAGLWPLLGTRLGAFPLLVTAFAVARPRRSVTPLDLPLLRIGVLMGVLVIVGNGAYIVATHTGLLSIVAVLASLYPASTVLLAAVLDGERSTRPQMVGMGFAVVAVVLMGVG